MFCIMPHLGEAREDWLVDAGCARRVVRLLVGCGGVAVADVVENSVVEQHCVLVCGEGKSVEAMMCETGVGK